MGSSTEDQKEGEARHGALTYDKEQAEHGIIINASGHKQELERQFSLVSMCAVGVVTGNAWAALGGSIALAVFNGGPPGVIYEFIAVSVFYWIIAACLAELSSAIPSSAGVYHWASVTGGRAWGKSLSWFAGWWNFFAWVFGAASISSILANQIITMWMLFRPDYSPQPWHVFIVYVILTWACAATVLFANKGLPALNDVMLFLILAGVLITILVCAIMPTTTGSGYASNAAVWSDWQNGTGWPDGFAFVAGMLNGAFAVGTPDCTTHLAEEIPNPRTNIPKAIGIQMGIGFFTTIFYLIAIFYSINDFTGVTDAGFPNPLGEVYRQATNSRGGSLGLLIVIFLPTLGTCIGAYITAGRMLYTLARDDATPFSNWTKQIHPRYRNPFNATLVCAVICTILAAIQVGNTTAFTAFVGSFVVLTTASFVCAILPYLLTGRKYVVPGPFFMPNAIAYPLLALANGYIISFIVIFCFPAALPFDAVTMNYVSVVIGGITIFISVWWFIKSKRGYQSPTELVMKSMGVVSIDDK
ncbi:Choline transport protein [Sphaceloma murrayae]|uniref:Choline transport protein n=1 Tax=Sphaceloma murrayae TaxID=2082308 RepID=A0A2K1QG53_9PEZI|nr:Choline transport protein [Sphaceloma murrayae]